jgi:heme exporter protein A
MIKFSGENLTCIRGERIVFSDLSFSMSEGEILYLKGPNGSGKSTLLRLMAGLLRPSVGSLMVDGIDIIEDEELFKNHIHYIGHQDAIKTALTVEENLSFWVNIKSGTHKKNNIREALNHFSLEKLSKLPAKFLSAGQRKRLNLARICASWAPLWLLDEPSNSLDSESLNTLNTAMSDHQAEGGMIAIATHDTIDLVHSYLDIPNFNKPKVFLRNNND